MNSNISPSHIELKVKSHVRRDEEEEEEGIAGMFDVKLYGC